MADQKKLSFSTLPKAEQFPPKFHGFQKRPKNTKTAFFGCFRPYVGQPDNHIG